MRVLVTRAEPSASQTAHLLRDAGLEPVVLPLFEIEDTEVPIPAGAYDGTIFTSGNAVEVLMRRSWRPSGSNQAAWCVGEKTATAARKLGFTEIHVSQGGGKALSVKISEHYRNQPASLLYPAPVVRAFDMTSSLKSHGIAVKLCEIYRHKKRVPDRGELEKRLTSNPVDCVTAYSQKSAEHTAEILIEAGAFSDSAGPDLVAISDNTASAVLNYGWRNVYVSEKPSEASMIQKIRDLTLRKV